MSQLPRTNLLCANLRGNWSGEGGSQLRLVSFLAEDPDPKQHEGPSAINFGVFAIGARDDYDEWASEVDDDTFGWKEMHIRYKNLQTFDGRVLPKNQKYVRSVASDHGHSGPLRVGYAQDWERDLAPTLDAFEAAGHKLNLDHNSGNPLGMAATINSA
ncbi:hypothetical protein CBS147326_2149 [Penicillium roqueforti]|nr:hypothetical protein CBS147326_2149 [Penicillium roqueforti]